MIQEISTAIDRIGSGSSDEDGRVCDFYKVSDLVGAKVYRNLKCATLNHDSQKALHKLGMAPEVLSKVIECVNGHVKRYLFLTELATTVMEICNKEDVSECICDGSEDYCECYICLGQDYYMHDRFSDIGELFDKLSGLGLNDDDQHWANYGYLKDGTPVVIDCEFYHKYR